MAFNFFRNLVLSLSLLLLSCRKDTVTNWDVDITGPVVSSKLNIKNFISDSLFSTNANQVLILSFNNELAHIKLDTLIKLPDTTFVNSYLWPSPFPTTVQPGSTINFIPPSPISFNISNGIALKWGIIHQGKLIVKYSNSISQPIDFYYQLPGVKKNNLPFSIIETVPPGQNSLSKSYDLAGYDIDLTAAGLFNYNTLLQNYTVNVNPNAQPAEITFGKGVSVEISYTDITPQYITGYFGSQVVNLDIDTAKLDLFQSFQADGFQLQDATLTFRIVNELGAEFSGSLFNVHSINTSNQLSIPLTTQQLSNININRAYDVNHFISPGVKEISLNKTNSNILAFLSNLPDKLSYAGKITLNPLGNTSGFNDFAYYNTGIKVLADINIPMRFNANSFVLNSDTQIDFSTLDELDNVNYGSFIINAVNGYPFDAILQAYLVDENQNIVDSLFTPGNNIISKGILNSLNEVVASTNHKIYVNFDQTKLEKTKRSKTVKIKARLVMPPNPPEIVLKDNYEIDVNIVLDVNYKVRRK